MNVRKGATLVLDSTDVVPLLSCVWIAIDRHGVVILRYANRITAAIRRIAPSLDARATDVPEDRAALHHSRECATFVFEHFRMRSRCFVDLLRLLRYHIAAIRILRYVGGHRVAIATSFDIHSIGSVIGISPQGIELWQPRTHFEVARVKGHCRKCERSTALVCDEHRIPGEFALSTR